MPRMHRKDEHSPEDKARLQAIRASLAMLPLLLGLGLVQSLPAADSPYLVQNGSSRTIGSVLDTQEDVFVAQGAKGEVARFLVKWAGIVHSSQEETLGSPLGASGSSMTPICRWTISGRIMRTVFQVEQAVQEVEQPKLSRTYATPYAGKDSGYSKSRDISCSQASSAIKQELEQAKLAVHRFFYRTLDVERVLIRAELEEFSNAAGAVPERLQNGIVLLLRGGNLDENIARISYILQRKGILKTRRVSLDPNKTLSQNLVHARVFFQKYVSSLDSLIRDLNKQNKEITVVEKPIIPGKPIVWDGIKTLIVPDLKLEFDSYISTINLQGASLSDFTFNKQMVRYYNDDLGIVQALPDKQAKLDKIQHLNPDLKASANIPELTRGTLAFPADGVKLVVPQSFVDVKQESGETRDLLKALLVDNVYFAGSKVQTEAAVPPAVTVSEASGQPCHDPDQENFQAHLKAIQYSDDLRPAAVEPPPRVFILDEFKLVQADVDSSSQNHKAYRNRYRRMRADGGITSENRAYLDLLREDLGISPQEAQMLEEEDTPPSPFIVKLAQHAEFRQHAQKFGPSAPLNFLQPDSGDHGYHIASIIAAHCNGYGITGLASGVDVIPYRLRGKYADPKGSNDIYYIDPYRALHDLLTEQQRCPRPCIVNTSFTLDPGPLGGKSELLQIIRTNREKMLIVAAAGNGIDERPGGLICQSAPEPTPSYYPACLGNLPNVLTVTAGLSPKGDGERPTRYAKANFSKDVVAIAAPGESIPGAGLERMFLASGTSQATAFVTAVLSLLQQRMPELTPQELKERILYTADFDTDFKGKGEIMFGWLNARRALFEPTSDIVYYGGPKLFEKTDLQFNRKSPYLELYIQGSNNPLKRLYLPSIRRIYQQRDGAYTVIYRDADGSAEFGTGCKLALQEDVSFLPVNERGIRQSERAYLSSRFKKRNGEPLDLSQVSDLIIKAGRIYNGKGECL